MTTAEKARRFAALHKPGDPLVLYNIWDAGGAKAVADAGAKAIATGSWSVAEAQGYPDGEALPLDLLARIAERIVASVALPVTIDFEGAYAAEPEAAAANVALIAATGAVGINFEDQIVGGDGLHGIEAQARRIAAIRAAAPDLFINARTDLFLKETDPARHAALMGAAKERAAAYVEAGGSGFFAPGLTAPDLIAEICEASAAPVNVLVRPGAPDRATFASLGVARISHGPGPYREAMAALSERAKRAL